MAIEALVFGEALWDLFPGAERLGGAPLNFAVRLAELGRATALLTRLGDDTRGRDALAALRQTKVDLSLIQTDPDMPTGTVPVTLRAGGSPDYVIVPDVAYDRIAATPDALDVAESAACVYWGTLAQRAPVSRATLRALEARLRPGALRLCDVNLRRDCYSAEAVAWSFAHATIVKVSDEEIAEVGRLIDAPAEPGRLAAVALDRWERLEMVVVTLGARGAMAVTGDGVHDAPGLKVDVVDLVGAGDAFTAACAHATLAGWPIDQRLSYANTVGSMVAGQPGATTPLDIRRLDELLAEGNRK